MPAQLDAALAELAAALDVALEPAQCRRLAEYAQLVMKWQRVTNLTAAAGAERFMRDHIADSLAVVPWIGPGPLLDVGSGAGLPGIVLAIACPRLEVTLLEPRARRARFLTQARIELELDRVTVACERLEEHRGTTPYAAVITRAFGSLEQFLAAGRHLAGPATRWLAMKASIDTRELEAGAALGGTARVETLTVPGFDHRKLVIFESRSAPGPAGAAHHR